MGRHTPGAGRAGNGTRAPRPSPARSASRWSAARSPNATPSSSARPSGTRARLAAYFARSRGAAAGKESRSTRCAAAAAAASEDAVRGARALQR
ncbi:hypothetical protein ACQI4E_30535 [Streptomyces sp. CA-252508]|uniref:hypothetical protein n=1 Tax=Streptomyces sp. CA-252508 TaxID=3418946 RepID=UPI003D8BF326